MVIRLSSFAQCPPSPYSTVRRHKSLRLRLGTDSTSASGMFGTGRRRPYDGFGRTRNWPSPCNHVAKLTCTEAATRSKNWTKRFPLLRNDLHGKLWLPLRPNVGNNRHVLYCTLTANRKQKNWSAHVSAPGGLHVRHRTKRVPADASTYMFHVTNRPHQGADEVRCRQRRDQKLTNGG